MNNNNSHKDIEIWDLYNEHKEIIGNHIRGNELLPNTYHLVVHVWIKNSKGEYLMSERSNTRKSFPLLWEMTGGSVLKGEDSITAAIREVKEELGLELNPKGAKLLFTKIRKTYNNKPYNDILDVYLFEYNGDVDLTLSTTDEVSQVVWMNRAQITTLYKENKLVESIEYFFDEVDK